MHAVNQAARREAGSGNGLRGPGGTLLSRLSGAGWIAVLAVALCPAFAAAQTGQGLLGGGVEKQPADSAALKAKIGRLENQVAADTTNYRLQYQLGNAYYDAESLDLARQHFEAAVRHNPKYVEALVNLGNVLVDQNQADKAVPYFEKALSINPEDCKARSNLGNAYYAQSRFPDAMFEYKRAVSIDPKCYSALYNIGVAFADAGLFREAVNYWKQVIQIAPGTDAARNAEENTKILARFTSAPPVPPAVKKGAKN